MIEVIGFRLSDLAENFYYYRIFNEQLAKLFLDKMLINGVLNYFGP